MRKTKKARKPLKTWEMIFCVGSLLLMAAVGIYYGYRSFYYFSKQNYKLTTEAATLNGRVVNDNQLITEGDGLHQDTDGYYFKGNVGNNYVKYSNRLFRVIRVNNDNSIRIISDEIGTSFMWGIDSNYETSNLNKWLDKGKLLGSGVYYDTLGGVDVFVDKTKYTIDSLDGDKVVSGDKDLSSVITTLGIKDYTLAGGKNSYLNINKAFWILGYQNEQNLFVSTEGSIEETSTYESYGVRALLTLKKNTKIIGGNGTKEDPYVIDQGQHINGVDSYVRLGNDLWKIGLDSKEGYYTLYSVDYLKVGDYVKSGYDLKDNVIFDAQNKNNIAYYLNTAYLNTLTYRDVLLLTPWKTGEISLDNDYDFFKVYDDNELVKIGLLNIFDYYSGELDDFFYLTNTGEVSDMVFIHTKDGYLEEDSTQAQRYVIPCVSINKGIIKGGTGTKEDPYTVG